MAEECSLVVRPKNAPSYKRQGKKLHLQTLHCTIIITCHRALSYPAKNIHRELRIEKHWFDLIAREHATHWREAVEDGIEFQLLLGLYDMHNTQTHS